MPSALSEVSIKEIANTGNWLKTQEYNKYALYGVSKGAEYALTAASYLPKITCVIAVSPIDYIMEGLTIKIKLTGTSSWSSKGNSFPYAPIKMKMLRLIRNCIKERQVDMYFIKKLYKMLNKDAIIPIWTINGSILFISADDDIIWPSN